MMALVDNNITIAPYLACFRALTCLYINDLHGATRKAYLTANTNYNKMTLHRL